MLSLLACLTFVPDLIDSFVCVCVCVFVLVCVRELLFASGLCVSVFVFVNCCGAVCDFLRVLLRHLSYFFSGLAFLES